MTVKFVMEKSGTSIIINYLKQLHKAEILTIDDLSSVDGLSYTNLRTILVKLCNSKVLFRLCRGVYWYPGNEKSEQLPSTLEVIKTVAEKGNVSICPSGEFARYLLGLRENMPKDIICYSTGKIKTFLMESGVNVKFMPSKRCFTYPGRSFDLRMLLSYVNSIGITNLSTNEKKKLSLFYKEIPSSECKNEVQFIPIGIKNFLI